MNSDEKRKPRLNPVQWTLLGLAAAAIAIFVYILNDLGINILDPS